MTISQAKQLEVIAYDLFKDLKLQFPLTIQNLSENETLPIPNWRTERFDLQKSFQEQDLCKTVIKEILDQLTIKHTPETQIILHNLLLALILPKNPFVRICHSHMYWGIQYQTINYDAVAKDCNASKEDCIDRWHYLLKYDLI